MNYRSATSKQAITIVGVSLDTLVSKGDWI